ncbi:hypothetical protein DL93DRAFT_2165440 [Clavulina sp. PMI_390]|nr:hypothetical protein DL93DRAFT_2165440 [Clavulina sp. PMI_390]
MGSSSLTALENSLKRSSPVPFDLFIINELSDALSAWNNFRNLLIPHLHRCRGILLASAYPAYGLFEQLFNGTKLGALKHLLLSWGRWGEPGWSTSPNPLPISFSHPALPLESLSLCDGHHVMPHDFLQSLLNSSTSSTLRRLRLVGAIPPKTVLPFLPHFQSLEHLTWQLKSPHTDKYYSATPINFPYLVTLTVSGFEGFRSFPPIIAPRLVQLTFAGNDHDDSKYLRTANSHLFSYKDYPPVSIFHPNQRFLPALRQLRFNPRFHQLDRVIRFLASHPLLNDVTIDNDPVVSMSEEDAKGLIIIINTLARSLPPATSTTTSPESPLTSLHVNFVGSRLDWGYGETLLAALIRLHKRASKVAIHYIGQDGLDVEAPMLPHFLEPCGDHEFHCVWREPWSECERLGNNLHQDDDDVWD